MQQLLAIVDQVREHYVSAYLELLRAFRAAHSPAGPEVLLEIPRETSYPFRLYRVDMASNSDAGLKIEEVNLSAHLAFQEVVAYSVNDARISLQPIAWNAVEFQVRSEFDRAALDAWALQWLDVDDEREQDLNGLQGVIHSISKPEVRGEVFEFSVDFGSAPVEAFGSLIALLSSTGAREIEIKSSVISQY